MKSFGEYLNESSLSRLWSKYKNSDSGTITAFRGERTLAENKKNNAELKAALIGAGFSVTEIDGVYVENFKTADAKEVKERSFIVFDYQNKGNLKQVLMKLGEKYDQDSITYSNKNGDYYLIGTSRRDNSYPGYKKEERLGTPMFGASGEFHSKVGGRPFVFNESTINEAVLEHGYDDTLKNYNTAHKSVLVRTYHKLCE